jgi:hypothetical protein
MSTFSIGEIVLYFGVRKDYHGQEVTVTRALEYKSYYDCVTRERMEGFTYGIDCPRPPRPRWIALQSELRKLKPPNEISSWSEIADIWKPRELVKEIADVGQRET